MAKRRSQVEAIIKCFAEALQNCGVSIDRIYLYGSYLHGTANDFSDIDIIVVSPSFRGQLAWERVEAIGIASSRAFQMTGESVEALAKTPEEIKDCHPASFLADILKDAEVIYEAGLVSA
ncbi:MAG: nucleotidyltransferase domain-containing protein [Armatimonadetes bacterium]|nr:nucleotidyltransferase domain-containing protein [Armatimonadota bacterium]